MSASIEGGTDVELNLAPIIDCFTVLITYLLVTASFITLSSVDVSVSVNGAGEPTAPPLEPKVPPMVMTLDLASNGELTIRITGGTLKKEFLTKLEGVQNRTWDVAQLNQTLSRIVSKWNNLSEVSISAAPTVKYKEIVNLINEIQKTLPKVYISGG